RLAQAPRRLGRSERIEQPADGAVTSPHEQPGRRLGEQADRAVVARELGRQRALATTRVLGPQLDVRARDAIPAEHRHRLQIELELQPRTSELSHVKTAYAV